MSVFELIHAIDEYLDDLPFVVFDIDGIIMSVVVVRLYVGEFGDGFVLWYGMELIGLVVGDHV